VHATSGTLSIATEYPIETEAKWQMIRLWNLQKQGLSFAYVPTARYLDGNCSDPLWTKLHFQILAVASAMKSTGFQEFD
jgi:hypothetical protein